MSVKEPEEREVTPGLEDFLGEPTRDLSAWAWLWREDQFFPVRSHRGLLGRIIVAFKRLLRPIVKTATNDLWDRQRTFNLVLLENLWQGERFRHLEGRTDHLEAFLGEGLQELMRYSDALYSRVDQKLDGYRREARNLTSLLGTAVAMAESEAGSGVLRAAVEDLEYQELEARHRGTTAELRQRLQEHLPLLAGRQRVLDLGCGRGEALEVLAEHGIGSFGVDASREMVRICQEKGLDASHADLLQFLGSQEAECLDGVVSFHVIEHLPPAGVAALLRLAWRALGRGGVLLLETPNPLSLWVAASSFWRDPSHLRPVHPDALTLGLEMAGFENVERRLLHPFPDEARLPEIEIDGLEGREREIVQEMNHLRDRLDEMLFGFQDYAVSGIK